MRKKNFLERMKAFKPGDHIVLHIRGIYGDYKKEGKLKKVDQNGFVYLDHGVAHSYRKIISIHG